MPIFEHLTSQLP